MSDDKSGAPDELATVRCGDVIQLVASDGPTPVVIIRARDARLDFEPAMKLRALAADWRLHGHERKAAELEVIADGLEFLALSLVR